MFLNFFFVFYKRFRLKRMLEFSRKQQTVVINSVANFKLNYPVLHPTLVHLIAQNRKLTILYEDGGTDARNIGNGLAYFQPFFFLINQLPPNRNAL